VVEAFEDVVGLSRREVAQALVERFGLEEKARARMDEFGMSTLWQAVVQVRLRYYEAMLADPEVLRSNQWPHNVALLYQARQTGCKVGLATMSRCEQAYRVLEVLDLGRCVRLCCHAGRRGARQTRPGNLPTCGAGTGRTPGRMFGHRGFALRSEGSAGGWDVATPFTRQRIHAKGLLDERWIVDDPDTLPDVVQQMVVEQEHGSAGLTDQGALGADKVNRDISQLKQQAAERAVEFVESGMVVGLGHGSTAIFAVRHIAQLLREGQLRDILGVPCSRQVEAEARRLGIPLTTLDEHPVVDLTIDGADEVDPDLNLIKGGGGALLHEKIVAQASRREIIVVDQAKLSPALGTLWPVPVEVVPFGYRSQAAYLESLGAKITLRQSNDGAPFETDQGNLILDCRFGPIPDPDRLAVWLNRRAGIVEHGLFLGLATDIIVAGEQGIRYIEKGEHNDRG